VFAAIAAIVPWDTRIRRHLVARNHGVNEQ